MGLFEYTNINISKKNIPLEYLDNEDLLINMNIKNIGKFDSFAIPKLYVFNKQSSIVRRIGDLKVFNKVFIKKRQVKEVTLRIGKDELSFWNHNMEFVLEKGDIELYLKDMDKELWRETITIK